MDPFYFKRLRALPSPNFPILPPPQENCFHFSNTIATLFWQARNAEKWCCSFPYLRWVKVWGGRREREQEIREQMSEVKDRRVSVSLESFRGNRSLPSGAQKDRQMFRNRKTWGSCVCTNHTARHCGPTHPLSPCFLTLGGPQLDVTQTLCWINAGAHLMEGWQVMFWTIPWMSHIPFQYLSSQT